MADEELKQNLENPTSNESEIDDSKLKEVAGGEEITPRITPKSGRTYGFLPFQ